MLKKCSVFLVYIFLFPQLIVTAQNLSKPSNGPEKGSLVIVGGNMKDTNIVLKFIELAGGKQAAFVDSYAHTLTEKAIREVLDRGGVIGGSSAGATIQG